jgi:hypothetical protein
MALFEAVSWNPERRLPPFEVTIEHPELARYHRDWGRPGDIGVIATHGEDVVGVALCRLFTDDDHGHGYVDAETPELAVRWPRPIGDHASARACWRSLPPPPARPASRV